MIAVADPGAAFLVTVEVGFGLFMIVVPPLTVFLVRRRLSWGISRRLLAGQPEVRVRTRYAGGAWIPQGATGTARRTPNVPGLARYMLDPDGQVVLEFRAKDGSAQRFVGEPVTDPRHSGEPMRRYAALVSISYTCAVGAGFALGYEVVDGSTAERTRAGISLGLLTLVLTSLATSIGTRFLRKRRTPDPGADQHVS